MKFSELLEKFKASEEVECLVQLLDDQALRRAVGAWQATIVTFPADGQGDDCPELESKRQWEWLWKQIKYDQKMFGTIANIKEHEISNMMVRLVGLRLVYPDGTINSFAKKYLQSLIVAKLAPQSNPRGRPPTKPKKDNAPEKSS